MVKRYVLDAGVLPLYFAGREDVRSYVNELYDGKAEAYMCEVNVAEFLYNYARVFGWEAAIVKHSLLRNSPIAFVEINEELTLEAAKLKHRYYKVLSLADCYLIALAKKRKATIVTTDRSIEEVKEAPTVVL